MVGVLTGRNRGVGLATVGTNFGGTVSNRAVFDANVPPLPEFAEENVFSF